MENIRENAHLIGFVPATVSMAVVQCIHVHAQNIQLIVGMGKSSK